MTATRLKDRQKFLDLLRKSNLLTPEQIEEAVAHMPETDRATVAARHLVGLGVLTKFQAEMLLAGRSSGFVLGQYRILDQLGRGGMGRVFKAMHQTMHRVVALKVVSNQLLRTGKAQQMFQREVRALARLIHPNIVTAYDANQLGDRYYMVMEFVDGPNLERLVRDKGPLPIGQACEFIRQAALGLQFAHEKGLVHRDIKPANLLVQGAEAGAGVRHCVVKILDFGLARLHSAEEPTGQPGDNSIFSDKNSIIGTPDYVAPEQAQDVHLADIRSDLYSLGCTLYFLVTGRVPFPGDRIIEKLVKHSSEEPTPIEQLRPDVTPAVAALVRRLMAKKPEARFQTPAELVSAINPLAVDGPPSWTIEHSGGEETPLATPTSSDGSPEATEVDDGSALAGTMPAFSTITPDTELEVPWLPYQPPTPRAHWNWPYLSVALAIGLVMGLLVLLVVLFSMW